MTATHFTGPVVSDSGFEGTLSGGVTGDLLGIHYGATPTAYSGADAGTKAISPAIESASLTKATAGTDYTLAAPGASNVNKRIFVYSTTAQAHVVTATGCLGGTTLTFGAAIGNSFELFAVSSTAWAVVSTNGVTQS